MYDKLIIFPLVPLSLSNFSHLFSIFLIQWTNRLYERAWEWSSPGLRRSSSCAGTLRGWTWRSPSSFPSPRTRTCTPAFGWSQTWTRSRMPAKYSWNQMTMNKSVSWEYSCDEEYLEKTKIVVCLIHRLLWWDRKVWYISLFSVTISSRKSMNIRASFNHLDNSLVL